MKNLHLLFIFGVCLPVLASDAPPIGNFVGTAFSSATSRHPVTIRGGTPAACEVAETKLDIKKCEIQDASLEVSGPAENALSVTFSKVTVLRSEGTYKGWHYYYKGSADVLIGGKTQTLPVSVVLNLDDANMDRVFGVIELPEQYAKTTIEGYRN